MNCTDKKLIELFNIKISRKINCNNMYKSRKASEEEYFYSYLIFLSNSVSFSRYVYYNERTKEYINGKYLNEKVNYWIKLNIFNEIYYDLVNFYTTSRHPHVLKNLSVDTIFVPNRFCSRKDTGRCVYYKSKFGLKINFVVDSDGTPIDISVAKGNENDSTIAIDRLKHIAKITKSNKYKKSIKYRRNILGDKIYDREQLRNECNKHNLNLIADFNIRNTKDPEKIKKRRMSYYKQKIYNKRKIVENSFSWETQYSPRFYRVFSRKPTNFLNEVILIAAKIILKRI